MDWTQMGANIGSMIIVVAGGIAWMWTRLDKKFDKIDERFNKFDQRFDKVDQRFDKVDQRLEKIESRVSGLEIRMSVLEERIPRRDPITIEISDVQMEKVLTKAMKAIEEKKENKLA